MKPPAASQVVIDRVRLVLREHADAVGIAVTVTGAPVRGTKLVRVYIVSRALAKMARSDCARWLASILDGGGLTPRENMRVMAPYVFATSAERTAFVEGLP